MKFYVDSCIWIDYFEDRKDNFKPLGEFAFQFLNYCVKNDFQILYSELVVRELLGYFSREKIELIFEQYKKQLVKVEETSEMRKESLNLKEKTAIPLSDITHALLAKENDAILISRDKHFELLQQIIEVRLPEEFI